LPLVRVALVSALIGHWIANAIADPLEYASVGLRYEGAALRPIAFQTAAVLAALIVLTVVRRLHPGRRLAAPRRLTSRTALTLMLTGLQMGVFGAMEVTERLALGETYAAAFHGGILDGGFVLELVVAIASALVLVALAIAVTRAVRSILSGPRGRTPSADPVQHAESPFVRPVLILAGSGGMRAPPTHGLPPRARLELASAAR
jgi:hypothetical protein